MKMMSKPEKERFQKAGLISDTTKNYYVSAKHRILAEETLLMKHYNAKDDQDLHVMLCKESPFANVSMLDIDGAIKF